MKIVWGPDEEKLFGAFRCSTTEKPICVVFMVEVNDEQLGSPVRRKVQFCPLGLTRESGPTPHRKMIWNIDGYIKNENNHSIGVYGQYIISYLGPHGFLDEK